MNERDALDDLDACEARVDIRRRAVRRDPRKHVLNGPSVFDTLTVTGDGRGRMKRGAHQIAVAGASGRDVEVHGACDRIMLGEIGVRSRPGYGNYVTVIGRVRAGALGAGAAPRLDLMPKGEDGVLLFVLTAVDRKPLARLPSSDGAFAAVEVRGDLLPRLQRFLRNVPLGHPPELPRGSITSRTRRLHCFPQR